MIPDEGKPILWEELSWKDVDKLTKIMKMAIIPTAACEQHGPHLPLSVDTIDCYEVAERVSANYETFFEYRMDKYSKSGVVGRGATKSTPELGEKLFGMVVEELVSMIQKALNEEKPKQHHNNNGKNSNATKKRK
jgi:creatinine amidohydrolase/Fe(II)-dependent formamide hydrolase-like protein